MKIGQKLTFTADLSGVCQINKGDQAIYLGSSQARITTGPSKDWLVWLELSAPVVWGK